MHARSTPVLATLAALIVLGMPPSVLAQSPEEQARTITHELMSPYCPGLLLADCQSEGARVLRGEILRRLRDGDSPSAVEEAVVAQFGTHLRTIPSFSGIGIAAWVTPAVVGVAGLMLVVMVVVRSARRRNPMAPAFEGGPVGDDATGLRIQDELDALD
jgi:cytochrome c-type biogenesis protein CcmH/NrfF